MVDRYLTCLFLFVCLICLQAGEVAWQVELVYSCLLLGFWPWVTDYLGTYRRLTEDVEGVGKVGIMYGMMIDGQ